MWLRNTYWGSNNKSDAGEKKSPSGAGLKPAHLVSPLK